MRSNPRRVQNPRGIKYVYRDTPIGNTCTRPCAVAGTDKKRRKKSPPKKKRDRRGLGQGGGGRERIVFNSFRAVYVQWADTIHRSSRRIINQE